MRPSSHSPMCGRYRLNRGWERDLQGYLRFINEKLDVDENVGDEDRVDVRPTDPMPVLLMHDGRLVVQIRRWGFLRLMPGATGKLVKKPLFNAKSETAPSLRAFRDAFASSRCLVPMSSWFEWPDHGGAKRKVEIAPRGRQTMLAAGLYETSRSPTTGEPVETFTMLTTTPTAFLGNVHDRAPLVVPRHHWEDWVDGDAAQAQALTGIPPDSDAYTIDDAAG